MDAALQERLQEVEAAYEEILAASEHARLLEFLGVKATDARLVQSSIKQSDPDLRAHIENFRELELVFQGSEYLAELYDYEN